MKIVNVHEAKTHLSRLLDRVSAGEEIILAKAGTPVARLVPVGPAHKPRQLGEFAGRFSVPEDFDEPLPEEVLAQFEGRR